MADGQAGRGAGGGTGTVAAQPPAPPAGAGLARKLRGRAPDSARALGVLALAISGGVLLLLAGPALAAAVVGAALLAPLALLSSPVWVPAAAALLLAAAAALVAGGLGAAAAAWVYRYARGRHPPGSGRLDYARSRIADTASHVKDCAREYGGYLRGRAKDAAPGA